MSVKVQRIGRKDHCAEPVLDEQLPGMLFDALATVQVVLGSANTGVPCAAMRPIMVLSQDERRELSRAVRSIATKHKAFFSEHKEIIEFTAVLATLHAAHVEAALAMPHAPQPGVEKSKERVCSSGEALVAGLYILAPIMFLAVVLIVKHLRRN